MPPADSSSFRRSMYYAFFIVSFYFWLTYLTPRRVNTRMSQQGSIIRQRIGIFFIVLVSIHFIFSDKNVLFRSTEYLALSNPAIILPQFPLLLSSFVLVLIKYLTVFAPFMRIRFSEYLLNLVYRTSLFYGILLLNAQNSRWLVVLIVFYIFLAESRLKRVFAGIGALLAFVKVLSFRGTTMNSLTSSFFGLFTDSSWFNKDYLLALLINVNQGITNLALGISYSPVFKAQHFIYTYSIIPGWPEIPNAYPRINRFVPFNAWSEVYYSGILGLVFFLIITGRLVRLISRYLNNLEVIVHSALFGLIILLQSQYSLRFSLKILCLQLLILETRRKKLRSMA